EKRKNFGLRAVVPWLIGSAAGFLLRSVQTIPFIGILSESYASLARPETPHHFRLWGAISEIFPGVLGSPLRGELDLTALPRAESFNMRCGAYVGAIVLVMLAFAWRELPATLRRGIVIGSIALLLSWYLPGIMTIVRVVPLLRIVALEYGAVPFVLFASLAAGPSI